MLQIAAVMGVLFHCYFNISSFSFASAFYSSPLQANAALHSSPKIEGGEGSEAAAATTAGTATALDDTGVAELEVLLSIPLASLALQVLQLTEYSELLAFLPWTSRKQVRVLY